jgi:hypothetical protein
MELPVPSRGILEGVKSQSLDPDRWGTIASTICAVHCAITGIAVSVLSIIGFAYLQSPILEWGFLGFALVFGLWAAVRGHSIHKSWIPVAVFFLGFILLAGSHIVEPRQPGVSSSGITELFSVLGGVSLIGFHFLNRKYMKKCS